MEERKKVVNEYIYKGLKSEKAISALGISRSSYYRKPKGGKKGKKPTKTTLTTNHCKVDNSVIIKEIKNIISEDFIDYGYEKVTSELCGKNYIINRKKVYRLMKENNLLNPKIRPSSALKQYVSFSQPYPGRPYESLEIDIKYIYIAGDRTNAYLISIIDVLTRRILVWDLAFSMKSDRVLELIDKLILEYLQIEELLFQNIIITIRSDNGSQFVAKKVRSYLVENQINHEFIKPATPQQNAYIESFHSLVEKLVCSKFEFESLLHAKNIFTNFMNTYNNRRIMKKLLNLSPVSFFQKFINEEIYVVYNIYSKKQLFFFRKQQAA